jgi:hypothetical protein
MVASGGMRVMAGISSNIGNRTKIKGKKCISDYYHLGVEIEEGKTE